MRKKDPALTFRMAALLESCRRASKQKVLFVNHNAGGGCEKHMQELAAVVQDKVEVVTIRSSGPEGVTLRLGTDPKAEGLYFILPQNYKELLKLCIYLNISRVHFHHMMGTHPVLRNLARDLNISSDITLHDYYFINSNPTLTDRSGKYCEDRSDRDILCAESHPIPEKLSPQQWRERQTEFLKKAERIFVPSQYTANLYLDYFPDLRPIVAWHPDWEKNAPYPNPRWQGIKDNLPLRIALLGALSKEKGCEVLESSAKMAKRLSSPLEFHLIGYAYSRQDSVVRVHGWYDDSELGHMISKIDPHIIWFPSQCPETYSYTLSAALESGRPLVVPDIGAFPERVRGRPLTWVETWNKPIDKWLELFTNLRDRMLALEKHEQSINWKDQHEPNREFSYISDYVLQSTETQSYEMDLFAPSPKWLSGFVYSDGRSVGERMLPYLLRFANCAFVARLSNFVPYDFRRRIKRCFSKKPIHEFLRKDL